MANDSEHLRNERKKVDFIETSKWILTILGFIIGLWQVDERQAEERGKLSERMNQVEKDVAANTQMMKSFDSELTDLKISITEIKTDLKYVKSDAKETLELMREFSGRNRN
jgi:hypothetical protein